VFSRKRVLDKLTAVIYQIRHMSKYTYRISNFAGFPSIEEFEVLIWNSFLKTLNIT